MATSKLASLTSVLLLLLLTISWLSSTDACKTRIIYKTVHVPVHIIKKVPVIKEVKVPVYVKEKHHHHHGHHKIEHHHENGLHHEKLGHKMHGGFGGGGGF